MLKMCFYGMFFNERVMSFVYNYGWNIFFEFQP